MSQMQRRAGTVGIVCLILVLFVAAVLLMFPGGPAVRLAHADDPPALTERELSLCLHTVSLDPESLAAAGVSDQGVAAVVAAGASYISGSETDMADVRSRINAARNDLANKESLVRRGHTGSEYLAALAAAREEHAEASAHLDQLLNGLFTTAITPLPSGQRALLTSIRANSSVGLPKAWLVVSRSQSNWIAIRDALACQEIAQRNNEEADANAGTILDAAACQTTSAALASADERIEDATAAFNSAVAALGQ